MAQKKGVLITISISLLVTSVFFYKLVFLGQLPFPGDLLIAEYKPWRTYSYLGYNPGSYPNKAQFPDTLRQLYPWRNEAVSQLKGGTLPLWNPHNFSGSPLLANFQSAALYPLGLLYFLFSMPVAWSILVYLQPVLGGLFMYWYIRSLKLSPLAGALAAASFAFGSFMTVWLQYNTIGHVILWLPLSLLAIELLRNSKQHRWFTLLIISLAIPFFAGHPQIAVSQFLFSLVYLYVRTKSIPKLILASVLPIGISGVQIVPGIELVLNSARSAHPYEFFVEKVLIQPWQLIMIAFPDIFGNPATRNYWPSDTYIGKVLSIGLVPLFFLPAVYRAKSDVKKIFVLSALITLLIATKNPVTLLLSHLPQFSTNSPTLYLYLFQFCLSVLTAIGLDLFIKEPHTVKKFTLRALQVIAIFIVGFIIVRYLNYTQGIRPLLYGAALSSVTLVLFFIAIRFKTMTIAISLLLLVHTGDLWYSFTKFNPFVPQELVFPETPIAKFLQNEHSTDRFWGYRDAAIEPNFATALSLYSPEGYDPLYPKWYGEFLKENEGQGARSDATISQGETINFPLLNELNVSYILAREKEIVLDKQGLESIYKQDGWSIYRNQNALPKAQLLLDSGSATINDYKPNSVEIKVNSTQNDILLLRDTYYPGWMATVNGEEIPVHKEGTWRAVPVPSGEHIVLFKYKPVSVRIGLFLTLVSLIVLAVLSLKHEKT